MDFFPFSKSFPELYKTDPKMVDLGNELAVLVTF
jgi:hypothetical protein